MLQDLNSGLQKLMAKKNWTIFNWNGQNCMYASKMKGSNIMQFFKIKSLLMIEKFEIGNV